jgi:ATP/maltotriose-dependent transcriptional regulator MalT
VGRKDLGSQRSEAWESQQMLEEMERANLFVVPLDNERQWYRYHDLFREALLARLQAGQPELVPLLHLRAARFYERASLWREAIAHALAAPDYAYAASLMEQAAPHFWLSGETRPSIPGCWPCQMPFCGCICAWLWRPLFASSTPSI